MKDRVALSILSNAIRNGRVNSETLIVESSSGNFAIALARICKYLGLRFIAVNATSDLHYAKYENHVKKYWRCYRKLN